MADEKGKDKTPTPPAPQKEKPKRIRITNVGENATVGHLGLKAGETTDHEDYVGMLKTKHGRRLVEEVK